MFVYRVSSRTRHLLDDNDILRKFQVLKCSKNEQSTKFPFGGFVLGGSTYCTFLNKIMFANEIAGQKLVVPLHKLIFVRKLGLRTMMLQQVVLRSSIIHEWQMTSKFPCTASYTNVIV